MLVPFIGLQRNLLNNQPARHVAHQRGHAATLFRNLLTAHLNYFVGSHGLVLFAQHAKSKLWGRGGRLSARITAVRRQAAAMVLEKNVINALRRLHAQVAI